MEEAIEKSTATKKSEESSIMCSGVLSGFFLAIGLFIFACAFAPAEKFSYGMYTHYFIQTALASLLVGVSFLLGLIAILRMLLHVQKTD